MALSFQVVMDCADPDRIARFWAEVLGYKEQEPPPGFGSWPEFLTAQGVPEEDWNKASAIVDPEGRGPRIFFQRVPESKTVKNRVHLDVNITQGPQQPMEERKRLVHEAAERVIALGATKLYEMTELGVYWMTMQDPEGNEFCLH